jgi:hypothetical protein
VVKTGEKRKRSWSAYFNQVKNDAKRYIQFKEKDKLRKRLERKNKAVSPSKAELQETSSPSPVSKEIVFH